MLPPPNESQGRGMPLPYLEAPLDQRYLPKHHGQQEDRHGEQEAAPEGAAKPAGLGLQDLLRVVCGWAAAARRLVAGWLKKGSEWSTCRCTNSSSPSSSVSRDAS